MQAQLYQLTKDCLTADSIDCAFFDDQGLITSVQNICDEYPDNPSNTLHVLSRFRLRRFTAKDFEKPTNISNYVFFLKVHLSTPSLKPTMTLYPVELTCHLFLHYPSLTSEQTLTLLSHLDQATAQNPIEVAHHLAVTLLDPKTSIDVTSPFSLKVQSLFWTSCLDSSLLCKENADLIVKMFKLYCSYRRTMRDVNRLEKIKEEEEDLYAAPDQKMELPSIEEIATKFLKGLKRVKGSLNFMRLFKQTLQ